MLSVNIGIDFGTSFTKAAFTAQHQSNPIYVKFAGEDNPFYKPSTVWYNNTKGTVSMEQKLYDDVKERYFKYTVIKDGLLPSHFDRKDASSETRLPILFCIFYLSNVINQAKEFVRIQYAGRKDREIDEQRWTITLGVPIDNFNDGEKRIYDSILMASDELSKAEYKEEMLLIEIDKYWKKYANAAPFSGHGELNTLPELYAESLSFIRDINTPNGLYALVDVGGGTVDIAILMRMMRQGGTPMVSIMGHTVVPLGIETVIQKIAKDEFEDYPRKSYRKYLRNSIYGCVAVDKESERQSGSKLSETFSSNVVKVKSNRDAHRALEDRKGELPVIVCGGGAHFKWYEQKIMDCATRLKNALSVHNKLGRVIGGLKLKLEEPARLLNLTGETEQRLIIAGQLSYPVEDIPDVDGFPWYYNSIAKQELHEMAQLEAERKANRPKFDDDQG